FAEEEVENERRRVLEELHGKEESAAQAALRLFLRALFPRHPYRLDPLGTPQSVAGLSRRRLLEFYRRHYPPERLTVALVGDAEPAQVIARLEGLLPPEAADWSKAPPLPPPQAPQGEGLGGGDAPPDQPLQVFKYLNKP